MRHFHPFIAREMPEGGAAEPPAPAAVEPAAAEPAAAPEWQGPSREEWERTQQFLTQAAPMLNEIWGRLPEPPAVPQPQEPTLDPFDPNSVQAYIESKISAGVESALEPFKPVLGMVAQERGQDLAKQALSAIAPEVGEFNQDAALLVASSLLDEPGIDPNVALRQAAEWARDFEKEIREDAVRKHLEDVERVRQAPDERQTNGTAVVENERIPQGKGVSKYQEVVNRVLAESAPTFPTG